MVRNAKTCVRCNYKLRRGRPLPRRTTSPEIRFWRNVQFDSECWIWTGATFKTGYGAFKLGGRGTKTVRAHRYAYELIVGPVASGLDLDHICENVKCVNPMHLRPCTRREHIAAAKARRLPA